MANKDDTQELVESTMSQSRIGPPRGRLVAFAALLIVRAAIAGGQAATAPPGTVEALTVPSTAYPPSRLVWVYTPPGYPSAGGLAAAYIAFKKLRDALVVKQYHVEYFEVPRGEHSPETWRLRLPIRIASLAPWR